MIDCVTLLVRWRDIFPQVEDQLPHEFQEHVTLTQGPVKCVSIKCRVLIDLIQFLCDGLRVYSGTNSVSNGSQDGRICLNKKITDSAFIRARIKWL